MAGAECTGKKVQDQAFHEGICKYQFSIFNEGKNGCRPHQYLHIDHWKLIEN
jgi:hypothetical protein